MNDNMVSNVNGNAWVYFKENTSETYRRVVCWLRLNITPSEVGAMHINEIVYRLHLGQGNAVCGLDTENTDGLGPYEY